MTMSSSWFERRLSVGNLVTIAIVVVGAIGSWYELGNRLNLTETHRTWDRASIEDLRGRIHQMERERNDLAQRVIRIEEKISAQNEVLTRILRKTERGDWRDRR